jgi:hypothetical protein
MKTFDPQKRADPGLREGQELDVGATPDDVADPSIQLLDDSLEVALTS